MLKVGLTGGIGSGKSTVAKALASIGMPIFDADKAAKDVLQNNAGVQQAVISYFGNDIYEAGILNRTKLAKQVFNNPEQLEILNSIVHPATIIAAETWMQQQKSIYVVKEAALLFEAGTAGSLHYIIGVTAPKHLRIQRVMHRDGVSRQEVLSRMSRQINDSIKMKLCDFVIYNDEQQPLLPQILRVHQLLLEKSNLL
jgi:dephospho-CoA kinase